MLRRPPSLRQTIRGPLFLLGVWLVFCLVGKNLQEQESWAHGVVLKQLKESPKASWNLVATLPPNRPDPVIAKRVSLHMSSSPLENCNVTAQVQIYQNQNDHEWMLQSLDSNGTPKTTGGDEFYVTYSTKDISLVAHVTDHHDGTYRLRFVTTPLPPPRQNDSSLVKKEGTTNATLTVAFQYTCAIGRLNPPSKQHWRSAAPSLVTHRSSLDATHIQPPWEKFEIPNTHHPRINLGQYDQVIAYGDSLMEGFVRGKGPDGGGPFFRSNVYWQDNPKLPLNLQTLDQHLRLVNDWHGTDLARANNNNNNNNSNTTTKKTTIALLLDSAAWDLLYTPFEPTMDGHLAAVEQFLTALHARYPTVDLYWKSPAALHVHNMQLSCFQYKRKCQQQTKYLAESRSRALHEQQQNLIQNMNANHTSWQVTYLDLYEAYYLSADYSLPGDGRHYSAALDRVLFNWFYDP